jgi:DNA-binding winged helix-turn-helix (wHTH) protein
VIPWKVPVFGGGVMQVRFGDFTLDTDSRQLRQGETERHLSPKGFELLRLLIENRPRALSKEELHARLWPATFVSDATLSSLVAEVRDALGETAKGGRFVRTVHRFGYAFEGAASGVGPHARSVDDRARCWIIWEFGQVALRDGEHLLGRDADVAVWLESPTISRHHARIRITGHDVTIEDLGSKNGTQLRGEPVVGQSPVKDGDEIRLGSVAIRFRIPDTPGSTQTQHSSPSEHKTR